MVDILLVSLLWSMTTTVWILAYIRERRRRIRAERAATHLLSLCHAMNDGVTFFVEMDGGGKPELRQ